MKFNRILAALLAVTVVGTSMPAVSVNFPKIPITANAAETESPLEYEVLEDGTIEITGCDKSVTTLEIPAEIDGKKVTSIGWGAFIDCSNLTEIIIPDGVTSIGDCAFYGCKELTEVTIPDSVTSIGGGAFSYTPWLETKQAENPLVIINGILIDGKTCSGNIVIPNNVTSICSGAFTQCESLTGVIIPNSVTSIDGAFAWCSNLKEITIPDSVTSIGDSTFYRCSKLEKIIIPDSITSIGDDAFCDTPWLEVKKAENPLVIINGILIDGTNCSGNVVIPDSVTRINYGAFSWCEELTEITIPNSVTSIGDYSFVMCNSLTSITIPDSVTSIGGSAFSDCYDLTEITILNPNCEIIDSALLTGHAPTIYGYENSTAQAYAEKYNRKFELISDAPESKVIAGDANCDGKVSIADATAILQHLGNQDKYGLSAEGLKNADVDENDGVSTNDALVIQMVDAKLLTVEQLPLKNK